MEPLIRQRRGQESTKAPIKVTTPLLVTNVNQLDTIPLNSNLAVKINQIEPLKVTKSVIVGPVIKKIAPSVTTPVIILYTTRKPLSTTPMVIMKSNNELVTKAPKAESEAIKSNNTSSQTNNEINHDAIQKAVEPNADSKSTIQTICLEEHTQNKLDNIHEDHIGIAGKENKEESQHTTYHVSDKNGKKITEITTTKIIEENSNNVASKHESHEKCDTLDLTDEHSSRKHLNEEKVKDKLVIAINRSLNETNIDNNQALKRNVESLTTSHEINSENRHCKEQEDKSHDIDHDTKNQTVHLLDIKLEYTKPLDKKITDELKECNVTQLEKKNKETQLSQVPCDHLDIKDPNITVKVLVDSPKVDMIKVINVSSVDLKPLKNDTTKPATCDVITDAVKEVPKIIIPNVNALLISNPLKPKLIVAPTRTILKIVNTTDCNTTKANTNSKSKDVDTQRTKMLIKVEMNSENNTAPVDCKNMLTASVVQNENGVNRTYTNIDIKLDEEKNGKFILFMICWSDVGVTLA